MIRKTLPIVFSICIALVFAQPSWAQSNRTNQISSTAGQSNDSKSEKPASPSRDTERKPIPVDRERAKRFYKAGVKYGQGGLFKQALQSFEQAITYDPKFADAYYGLGHAYYDLGRYQEAIVAFQKVLELDPGSKDAYEGLGRAHTKLNQQKMAPATSNSSASGEGVALSLRPVSGRDAAIAEVKPVGDQTQTYRVGIGDVLDIRVGANSSESSTLFTVSSAGTLEHPLVGQPLKVVGLTTDEIAEQLGAELKRRSIKDADPEVGVREYNSHTILVSGLIKEPGTKILRREAIPLYVVLADAQPLPNAALVTIMSQHGASSRTIELLSAPEQSSLLVQPGDVITVRPALQTFFYIGGNVKSPGELPFRSGLTLTQAILSAGGVSPKGEKVQLTRGQGNGLLITQEFNLKEINKGKTPDPLVQPGDRIRVLP